MNPKSFRSVDHAHETFECICDFVKPERSVAHFHTPWSVMQDCSLIAPDSRWLSKSQWRGSERLGSFLGLGAFSVIISFQIDPKAETCCPGRRKTGLSIEHPFPPHTFYQKPKSMPTEGNRLQVLHDRQAISRPGQHRRGLTFLILH